MGFPCEKDVNGGGQHDRHEQYPAILTVNRQISNECIPQLRTIAEFNSHLFPCLMNFLPALNDSHRSKITKLGFSLPTAISTAAEMMVRRLNHSPNGPSFIFFSMVRNSCEYFSKASWSLPLGVGEISELKEPVFTMSTSPTAEEAKPKNVEDGLPKDSCIVHGSPLANLDNPALDKELTELTASVQGHYRTSSQARPRTIAGIGAGVISEAMFTWIWDLG